MALINKMKPATVRSENSSASRMAGQSGVRESYAASSPLSRNRSNTA
jgi:hypothetical protein